MTLQKERACVSHAQSFFIGLLGRILVLVIVVSGAVLNSASQSRSLLDSQADGDRFALAGHLSGDSILATFLKSGFPRYSSQNQTGGQTPYERNCDPRRSPAVTFVLPVNPDPCSDSLFVLDNTLATGGHLDLDLNRFGCQGVPSGTFNVPIDRYIGDAENDMPRLLQNGLIRPTATLRINTLIFSNPVPVVDSYFVTFNNKKYNTSAVTGSGDIVISNIPVEDVIFPSAPGAIGTNVIKLERATSPGCGGAYFVYVDWVSIEIDVVRPVLLVHGLDSKPEIWNTWLPKFDDLGMSKGTPNADDPREQPERSIVAAVATLDPCGTIEVNGDRLKTEIDKMRSRLKVDKINILAHSKGGLEARYADSKGYEKYISQIIQLGTPNGGSFLADYRPPGWRWGCPAEITDQLTTESMAAFNVAYPAGSSVDYTVLAGDIDGGIFDIFKDDRVVSVASVFSIEAESLTKLLYRGFDAGHSDLYQSNSVFDCISPAVLSLSWPQPSFPCLAPEERATRAGNPAVATLTPRIGTIFGGETKTESFTIDMASNVTFQLIYRSDQQNPGVEPGNNLNLTLISPNGIRIPVPDDEEDGLGARSLRQNFATLQTGIWNVEVTAATVVGTPPVPYGIFISGNSPVIDFDGSFESSSICSGETLQLRGRLRDETSNSPIVGAVVGAVLAIPDEPNRTSITLSLVDDGTNGDAVPNDGIYSFDLPAATVVGDYRAQFTASRGPNGSIPAFDRQDNDTAFVSQSCGEFTGKFSDSGTTAANAPSAFSSLVIQAGVNIDIAGNYVAVAEVTDSANHRISSRRRFTLAPGIQTLGLEFSGEQIYQNQTNGSFTLSKLSLFQENSGRAIPVSISNGGNLYQTAAYQYLDFQVSPIRIERNGTALGVDTNSNGLFDILRVNLPVNVRQAGAYSWSAVLTDRNGNQIGKTVGNASLNAGSNIAVLNFNARNIGYNGVSGPYVVTGVSIKGAGTSVSDKNVLVTPPFASTLFETCTYSVTPAALNVGASSQSGTIAVTAETGCYWNVRESSSWLSPFTFGSGTGTLNYFISFNPGEARSGSISVGRVVIPVNQSSNCTFALSPASPQSVASTGGSLSVNVTTGSTCTWTAVSSVPWITVTSGSSGSGNGTASLQIAANVGAARSGSVTIAGQDYVINQAASSSCNYSLSPSSTTISESGGAGNFGVTSNDGCTWSATSNALWITTSSTGSGNGTVTFTVAANSGNARSGSILVAGQAFTVNQSAASSGPIVPVKVSSADSALSDFFGNSVSINGNTAIVGANGHAVGGNDDQGAAYVYVRNGTSWVLQQKLTMPTADAQVAAQFGYSVAISGDTVIVGSPTQDNGGNIDQGAAYVYVRSGTTWTFQQRLRQSDGAAGDNFGWSVAIDGNTAVVGAYLDDESVYTNCGSAYAYLRTGSTWAEESRMVSSERTSNSQMGYSVGISGDTVIIGARLAQSSTSSPDFGSAYIFTPVAGTPRIWTQRSILTAPQRGAGDQFGFSVGVNGNTALIGARFDDVGSNVDQGSAYVFTGSGNTWSFQRQLLANDGIANDEFGNAVSISGDKLIIGAPQNSSRNGKAYLFTGIGANWSQLPVVVAPDGSLNDLYGSSVAINGSNAVVGAVFDDARRGSVYFLSGIPSAKSKLTADFDGDGKTDLSVFRPTNGQWWLGRSTDGLIVHTFGNSSDILTPGDFTGDGKSDVSIFRPSSGEWFVLRSEDSSFYSFPFGANGDVPVPADYDGDGKTDAAVFRSSNSTWYIQRSSGGTTIQGFGVSGDRPVPADYDGDGKADIAVFRPSLGQWWLNRSTAGGIAVTFGSATDRTVQGDYTGDGKTDIAIWRPSNGEWFILRSEDFTFYSFPFGAGGDTPAPGDYDGDGKTDAAVFRPSNSTWYVQRSTAGTLIQGFGLPSDLPVPNAYVR